jgi:hypothetical protein
VSEHGSVLIVRDDGVIHVPGAISVPAQLADAVDRLLDTLGTPRREERQRRKRET